MLVILLCAILVLVAVLLVLFAVSTDNSGASALCSIVGVLLGLSAISAGVAWVISGKKAEVLRTKCGLHLTQEDIFWAERSIRTDCIKVKE